ESRDVACTGNNGRVGPFGLSQVCRRFHPGEKGQLHTEYVSLRDRRVGVTIELAVGNILPNCSDASTASTHIALHSRAAGHESGALLHIGPSRCTALGDKPTDGHTANLAKD